MFKKENLTKFSKKRLILIVAIGGAILLIAGVLTWANMTGRLKLFAASEISNTVTATYKDAAGIDRSVSSTLAIPLVTPVPSPSILSPSPPLVSPSPPPQSPSPGPVSPTPTTKGTLTGKVTNSNTGAVITGATVRITYPNGSKYSVTTSSVGTYTWSNLAPGTYTLKVSMSRYRTQTKTVNVVAGNNVADFSLVPR